MTTLGLRQPLDVAPRDRILDVYASFVRAIGGWLAVSDLIALLDALGVDEQATRSATSRMKRGGLLQAEKVEGQAGYCLSPTALAILQDGDKRIFRREDHDDAGGWVIALFSVPEAQRSQRYQIRSRLERLGFGQDQTGSWFAPAAVLAETRRELLRNDLTGFVTLWVGSHQGFGDLRQVVAQSWDLAGIAQAYRGYLAVADQIDRHWSGEDTPGLQSAWVDYLDNLASWRSLPYQDPGLPPAVAPQDWPAAEARRRFLALDDTLKPLAAQVFTTSIQGLASSPR
ncbi:MAG: PaaX family transcriptional regulator [Euzebya sp.]